MAVQPPARLAGSPQGLDPHSELGRARPRLAGAPGELGMVGS
ncbi:hypothetical protein [Planotetraspora kaengkrachanensis]|nr:hypothetical protein [Planotetraspora kaengkrachanensis]